MTGPVVDGAILHHWIMNVPHQQYVLVRKLFHPACARRQLKTSLSEPVKQGVNKTLQLALLF